MADIATFQTAFPSFSGIDAALLTARLNTATKRLDPAVWGSKLDDGIYFLMAHMLALDPMGNGAELVGKADGDSYDGTAYGKHFKAMRREVASGFRVT